MSRRNRFVTAETVRLDLSDGDWVEIKARLTYEEAQKLGNASLVGLNQGGYAIDVARFRLMRLETWLVDWNFADNEGKSVPLSPSAIRNLDPETAEEILDALDAYQMKRDADPKDKLIAETSSKPK